MSIDFNGLHFIRVTFYVKNPADLVTSQWTSLRDQLQINKLSNEIYIFSQIIKPLCKPNIKTPAHLITYTQNNIIEIYSWTHDFQISSHYKTYNLVWSVSRVLPIKYNLRVQEYIHLYSELQKYWESDAVFVVLALYSSTLELKLYND
jgi:hypothetical protein